MRHLISAMLLVVAAIHLIPVLGVLGAQKLSGLYGIALSDANLLILMRHRAVLFGLLGLFMALSVLRPSSYFRQLTGHKRPAS
jgi:hypothetical protein